MDSSDVSGSKAIQIETGKLSPLGGELPFGSVPRNSSVVGHQEAPSSENAQKNMAAAFGISKHDDNETFPEPPSIQMSLGKASPVKQF